MIITNKKLVLCKSLGAVVRAGASALSSGSSQTRCDKCGQVRVVGGSFRGEKIHRSCDSSQPLFLLFVFHLLSLKWGSTLQSREQPSLISVFLPWW